MKCFMKCSQRLIQLTTFSARVVASPQSLSLFSERPRPHNYLSMNCLISDIDECRTGGHSCQQVCNNLPGTYNCSCDTGFMLNNDSRTCSGRNLGRVIFYDYVSFIVHCLSVIKSINCQNINRSEYVAITKHCNLKAA